MPENGDLTVAEKMLNEQRVKDTAPAVDPHAGCVKRELNFQDRRLILMAVASYCSAKEQRGDYKFQRKAAKVREVLVADDVDEYFEQVTDDANKRLLEFQVKLNTFNEVQRKGAKADWPGRPEKMTEAEECGATQTLWVPSKLDAFIQDALKAMQWQGPSAEYVASLCDKYGFKDEE